MNTDELVPLFIASRRLRRCSPATVAWYRGMLLPFALAIGARPATVDDIEQFVAAATAAASARTRLRALRAMYRWAADRYDNPDPTRRAGLPIARPALPRVLTVEELRRLVREASRRGPVDYALITTLADTGIRIGELASLRVASLDTETHTLRVSGKTGGRLAPASPETFVALAGAVLGRIARPADVASLRLQPPGAAIWRAYGDPNRPMAVASLKRRAREIALAALGPGRKLGPHTLRHTMATYYLQGGGNIHHLQRILGHASIKQTTAYLHLADADAFVDHERLSPLRRLA